MIATPVQTQIALLKARIIYLDDHRPNLKDVERQFGEQGIKIETTLDIEHMINKALKDEVDIVLCDQRLDQITHDRTGYQLLRQIRNHNRTVFLALYTAYRNDLNRAAISQLELEKIFIYEKDDHEEFVLNLEQDYKRFRAETAQHPAKGQDAFYHELAMGIRDQVLRHLRGVSNQEATVPIQGERDIRVRELIGEVQEGTGIGLKYVRMWCNAMEIIKTIQTGQTVQIPGRL